MGVQSNIPSTRPDLHEQLKTSFAVRCEGRASQIRNLTADRCGGVHIAPLDPAHTGFANGSPVHVTDVTSLNVPVDGVPAVKVDRGDVYIVDPKSRFNLAGVVHVANNADGVTITDPSDTGGGGIDIAAGCKSVQITGGRFLDNKNAIAAIRVASCQRFSITGTLIFRPPGAGIRLENTAPMINSMNIIGPYYQSGAGAGAFIEVHGNAPYGIISNNLIYDGAGADYASAIFCASTANHLVICGNNNFKPIDAAGAANKIVNNMV